MNTLVWHAGVERKSVTDLRSTLPINMKRLQYARGITATTLYVEFHYPVATQQSTVSEQFPRTQHVHLQNPCQMGQTPQLTLRRYYPTLKAPCHHILPSSLSVYQSPSQMQSCVPRYPVSRMLLYLNCAINSTKSHAMSGTAASKHMS